MTDAVPISTSQSSKESGLKKIDQCTASSSMALMKISWKPNPIVGKISNAIALGRLWAALKSFSKYKLPKASKVLELFLEVQK